MRQRQYQSGVAGNDRAQLRDLEIQEGGQASLEFLRVQFGDAPEAERKRVRRQLEEYCGLDTMGMVWIVEQLRKLIA